VQALACCHQGIEREKRNFLYRSIDPVEVGVIAIGQMFPLFDHRLGEIYGINPLNTMYQPSGNISRTTPNIKYSAGFVSDEIHENVKDLIRVRRAKVVGIYNATVSKACGKFRAKVWRSRRHL